MKNIIVCGDCGERLLTKAVFAACRNHGGALLLEGSRITQTVPDAKFLIVCVNTLTEVDCRAVLVMGEALCQIPPVLKLNGVTAVSDSGNIDALKILGRTGAPVLGCSASDRDTLTLSCKSGRNIIFSLQRPINTLSGRLIEPCEIKIHCDEGQTLYPALAACCTMLLCDIPHEQEYDISTGYIYSNSR